MAVASEHIAPLPPACARRVVGQAREGLAGPEEAEGGLGGAV